MLILAFGVAALAHRYLKACAPSNALVARVRRGRPRPRVVAGLLALSLTLVAGALLLAGWVASGGPGWLNLVILIAVWDAMKLAWLAVLWPLGSLSSARRRPMAHPANAFNRPPSR